MRRSRAPDVRLIVGFCEGWYLAQYADSFCVVGLLEQQGIHREPGHGKADTDTSDSADKPSMGQKIKEKILLG